MEIKESCGRQTEEVQNCKEYFKRTLYATAGVKVRESVWDRRKLKENGGEREREKMWMVRVKTDHRCVSRIGRIFHTA